MIELDIANSIPESPVILFLKSGVVLMQIGRKLPNHPSDLVATIVVVAIFDASSYEMTNPCVTR